MAKLPKNIGSEVIIKETGTRTEPVGRLADYIGQEFKLAGPDGSGQDTEWVVRPTGPNSFELVVPSEHELGTPDAWENISIMTQRVVRADGNCGCDGNQCGCQGQNCGSNCNSNAGRLALVREATINPTRLRDLRERFSDMKNILDLDD